ncbi:MAG: Holliday junction branch migration protein RuvA [Paludibacteraceae bacterium]|nr:Holliday junction branch migration protein RuvA [Paludibacteraceae bacterium]
MIDYIKGTIDELTPTYVVVEASGVGYEINITLQSFTQLQTQSDTSKIVKLYVTEIIREDSHLLYGFLSKSERELFLLLTTVSGIGPNTARMIMSGYNALEIRQIIATGNATALSRIKGLGAKTAQRIIVDLKDKILKITPDADGSVSTSDIPQISNASAEIKNEAVAALTMLGFPAAASGKVADKILRDDPSATVESVIRLALKML